MGARSRHERGAAGALLALAAAVGCAAACSLSTPLDDLQTHTGSGTGGSSDGGAGTGGGDAGGSAGGGAGGSNAGGRVIWARSFGAAADSGAFSVAVDAAGDAYITGYADGVIDFGGGTLPPGGGVDLFIARLDADGKHVWSKRYGDSGAQYGNSIAVDPEGNVIVVGAFSGNMSMGVTPTITSAGLLDVFVTKLDPEGNELWTAGFGGVEAQGALSVATDAAGNILVGGYSAGTLDFGCGPLVAPGQLAGFVAMLSAGGACLWSHAYGDSGDTSVWSVTAGPEGNVFVGGTFTGKVDFGGGPVGSNGNEDIFLVSLDAIGHHLWSRTFGDANRQSLSRVSTDAAGDVFVVGGFEGTMAFGSGNITSAGGRDVFAAKLASNGEDIWGKPFGGPGDQVGTGRASAAGALFLGGSFEGSIAFGANLLSQGGLDAYVSRLDAGGMGVWARGAGSPENQAFYDVAFGADGVVVGGEFSGTIDVGTGQLISAGGTDIIVAKFSP